MKIFYYTLHIFSGKNLCINCFRKIARTYLWVYLSIAIFSLVALIALMSSAEFRKKVYIVHQCIIYFVLAVITLSSFILARICKSLVSIEMTPPPTY